MAPKEKANKAKEREAEDSSEERYLKYTGDSDVRVITKEDWDEYGKRNGLDDFSHDTVEFNRGNGWMVPVSAIGDDRALNYFVSVDPEFKVEKSARVRAGAATMPAEQATSLSQLPDAPSPFDSSGGGSTGSDTGTGGASGGAGSAGGPVGGSTDGAGGDTT